MKKIPTAIKWIVGAVIIGGLAYLGQYLFSKYITKEGAVSTGVPAMPELHITTNGVQTDDYTIRFGNNFFYYSLGDAPIKKSLDNIWSLKFETVQALNKLQITAYQNNNPVFTKIF